ncbi:hypothetical protein HDZ31DRAFT_85813 [Schizophyllum fasciatum]
MVLVNNIKYACGTCIKGHRSSTCKHSDRPLFEIKRKGRPVTQCEHCRELRKTKQVHVKCVCEKEGEVGCAKTDVVSIAGPTKVSETPAFPNGLPESVGALATLGAAADRKSSEPERIEEVKSSCKSGSQCDCCVPRAPKAKVKAPKPVRSSSILPVKGVRALSNKGSPSPQHPEFPLFLSDSVSCLEQQFFGLSGHLPDPSVLHPAHDPSIPLQARVRIHSKEYSPYGRAYDQHAHYYGHSPPLDRGSSIQSSQRIPRIPSIPPPDDYSGWFSDPSPFCQVSNEYSSRLLEISANNGSAESMGSASGFPPYEASPDIAADIDIDMNTRLDADAWMGHCPDPPPNPYHPSFPRRLQSDMSSTRDGAFWDEATDVGTRSAPSLSLCMDFGGLGCVCPPGDCRCGAADCWVGSMSSATDSMPSMSALTPASAVPAQTIPPDHAHLCAMPDLMRSRSSSSSSSSGASSVQSFRDAFESGSSSKAFDATHSAFDGARPAFDGEWAAAFAGCAEDLGTGKVIDGLW